MSPELGESASDQQNKLSEEEDKEYKVKYRDLKRTLKNVVSKNEYLKSELRHSQKKLQVTKDLKQKLLNFLKSSNRIFFCCHHFHSAQCPGSLYFSSKAITQSLIFISITNSALSMLRRTSIFCWSDC